MTPRSDMTLEWHLREVVAKEAVDGSVKEAVRAVFTHMHSGRSRQRRGGREIVRLLEGVRAAAADAGEWQVVRLVQDAIEYAEGRILLYDFEDRYRLFADGKRRESHTGALASVTKAMHRWLYDSGQEFLAEHPEAGIEDFLEHFRAQGEDALFLQAPEDRPGRYVIPRGRAEITLWLERIIRSGRIDVMDPAVEARRIVASPEALALLAADDQGRILLQAAELRRRAARLKELRTVVEDRTAAEADVQRALEGQYWIFGGRFVDEAAHRRLVPGDEVDIPLIRGDGALHIVELKRSMSLKGPLVKRYRDAWVPAAQVHEAVGQAVNYLTGLDENRERIRADFGIETRRASALVLVGHPALHPEVPEEEVNEALRTFNAHLTRVEVLTYKELVDNAERSLAGDGPV
ncbi:Shedu anti-phage system protein SduA domain-containing protein [Streptomyces luteogriseus]|uniref:Shedu anti-phage system protein SduA domain-containing protein n=1 Tax=Streptomyces luteogriseus TaxID=68233 RepID=UPI00261A3E9B|nr:Shedu anti-phage system protein SduA domain-containing protein [uncultured Streptomyces sp.]